MARKKKKQAGLGQLALKLGKNDERIPKLLGLLALFFSFYLFVAFTSYLFTWKLDQDSVLHHSWGLLLQGDLQVDNWLGRLGAIVSNLFIYWGFGLPSFLFVFLLFVLGQRTLKRVPLRKSMRLILNVCWLVFFTSVVLEFLFRRAQFPVGGTFGSFVSDWLTNFVGTPGTIALFLFVLAGIITWIFNPNYNEMNRRTIQHGAQKTLEDIKSGKIFKPTKKADPVQAAKAAAGNTKSPQRPLRPGLTKASLELETDTPKAPEVSPLANAVSDIDPVKKGEQLAFELPDKKNRKRPESLTTGQADLEIETPTAKEGGFSTDDGVEIKPPMPFEKDNKDHKDLSEPYDPTLDLSAYEHPVFQLLNDYDDENIEIDRAELERNKDQIIETLLNYKIEIIKIKATIGPTVTLYEIVPAPGVRISKIKNLEDDIALSLAALGIRIIAPIPGRGTIGIEVPNKNKQIVGLKEVLMSERFRRAKMDLPIALGKTISNEVFVADLAKMPHLLIAGATGQGKSVGINVILSSLLYKKHPSQVKFVLIDPKKVELFPYAKLENHFLASLPDNGDTIITETNQVVNTLNSLLIEMDTRYNLLKKAQARNIKEYNEKFVGRKLNPEKGHKFMPFIVLIIDEFADLIMTAGKEIEHPIGRLAQLSRAVGIHLIIATQRPSVNIITGVIKANFPARIAYRVTAKVDSRTILDTGGADRLIGRGDMLLSFGSDLIRLQCAFIDTPEVEKVLDFIAQQKGYPTPFLLPEYHGDTDDHKPGAFNINDVDDMMDDAARLVVQNQHGSTSMIQRRLKLGYNRAGRIMDQLEALGIVGPSEGSKAREVLFYDEQELERYLVDIRNRK